MRRYWMIPFYLEPGYYEDGKFGIRLETVIMAVDAETKVRRTDTPSFK